MALVGGRAKACRVNPDGLCRAMLNGIKSELVNSGIIHGEREDMMMVSAEDAQCSEYLDQYIDDISGRPLVTEMVVEAREAEMEKFSQHKVYTKVPISECIRMTGKQPIGCKWIDINKGDAKSPNYRSRLVAKEIKRGPSDEMFAATPPLEAKKCICPWP